MTARAARGPWLAAVASAVAIAAGGARSGHADDSLSGQLVIAPAPDAVSGFTDQGAIALRHLGDDHETHAPHVTITDLVGTGVPIELAFTITPLVADAPNPFVIEFFDDEVASAVLGGGGATGFQTFTRTVPDGTSAVDFDVPVFCDPAAVGLAAGDYAARLTVADVTVDAPAHLMPATVVTLRCTLAAPVSFPTAVTVDDDMPDQITSQSPEVTFRGEPGTLFYVELPSAEWSLSEPCSLLAGDDGSNVELCRLPFAEGPPSLVELQDVPLRFAFRASYSATGPISFGGTARVIQCTQLLAFATNCVDPTVLGTIALTGASHGGSVTPLPLTIALPSVPPSRLTSSRAIPLRNLGDRTVGFDVALVPDEGAVTPFALVPGDGEDAAFHTLSPDGVATAPVVVTCDRRPDVPVGNYTAHLEIVGSDGGGAVLSPYSPFTPPPIPQLHGAPPPAETATVPLACIVSDARVEPEVIDFHTLVAPFQADPAPVTVTITNESSAAIDVASIAVGQLEPATIDIQLDAATQARQAIAPGDSFSFDVTVGRTAGLGAFSAVVTFTTTEGGTDVVWTLPVLGQVRDDLGPPPGDDADDDAAASYYTCSTGGRAGASSLLVAAVTFGFAVRRRRRGFAAAP